MARRIPEDGDGINWSERQVFDELCRQLPDEATVLPNLRFTDREGDREADAVVVWPGVGVAVIEIKGAVVEYDGGGWHQHLQSGTKRIDPVEQALKAKYAMRGYLRRSRRWKGGDPRMVHHVVLPRTDLPPGFQAPQCPREHISDRADVGALADRLRRHLDATSRGAPPDGDDAERLVEALAGPSTPQIDLAHDVGRGGSRQATARAPVNDPDTSDDRDVDLRAENLSRRPARFPRAVGRRAQGRALRRDRPRWARRRGR